MHAVCVCISYSKAKFQTTSVLRFVVEINGCFLNMLFTHTLVFWAFTLTQFNYVRPPIYIATVTNTTNLPDIGRERKESCKRVTHDPTSIINWKSGALSRGTSTVLKIEERRRERGWPLGPSGPNQPWTELNAVLKGFGYYLDFLIRKYPRYLKCCLVQLWTNRFPWHSEGPGLKGPTSPRHFDCHPENERQKPFVRRLSHACNIYITGKWDVPGSPSKPEQTGRTNNYKRILKNYDEKFMFPTTIVEKLRVYWKNARLYALRVERHFMVAYIPSPREHHYNEGTVNSFAQFQNMYQMFHCLTCARIIPSFNIGIILALIYCVYLKYKGEKEKYSTTENTVVRRGVFIAGTYAYVQYRVKQLVVKIWGENKKRSVVARTYAQPNNLTQQPNKNSTPQPNNNSTTQHNNPTTDATPNEMRDAINENGGRKACVLEEGTAVGTNMREANKNVAKDSELEQEPLPTQSKSHGVIWASGGEEYDEDYDVYEHLDKVPITMPPPLGPKDFMYYPSQVAVFGTENKGPLRPVDQKPNMRGDSDYDTLSPKQQEKRDWDQYYEYQEKVLAGTSKRKSQKPKIKTQVWRPTKPTPQLKDDFGAELKRT